MPAEPCPDGRVTVVIATRNRRAQLLRTLARLADLPERPPVIVVDNASSDGTADAVAADHPWARLIRSRTNLGAVGRNLGVRETATAYVGFCDDDTWWEPGALARAADLLDAHPRVASITGRIIVEPGGHEDPIVPELRDSPVPSPPGLPGPALLSILAGASVLRTSAFREAGGFSPRLWLGGEEELLSVDLACRGWYLCYSADVRVHHEPSPLRDPRQRRRLGIRNTLWVAWLRRPVRSALRRTFSLARAVPRDAVSAAAFCDAVMGLGWVLRERRRVPPQVEAGLRLLEEPQRNSPARRYIG